MSEYKTGTPQWLLDKGVGSVKETDGIFPDYNSPIFLDYHERLIRAFGERYGRSSISITWISVPWDVGASGIRSVAKVLKPSARHFSRREANQMAITDWYLKYFSGTPLVMLHGGQLKYATCARAPAGEEIVLATTAISVLTGIIWSMPMLRCSKSR